jgi:hypothetical protein
MKSGRRWKAKSLRGTLLEKTAETISAGVIASVIVLGKSENGRE